jgi:hypothetical protein
LDLSKQIEMWQFLTENWAELLLAVITLAGTVTGLTASEKDDQIVDKIRKVLSAILVGKPK